MNKNTQIILSEQRLDGKILKASALFVFLPVVGSAYFYLKESSAGLLFAASLFLLFSGLLFCIGHFQSIKFKMLGSTPLSISPSVVILGEEFSGSVEINRKNFNKVRELKISLWKDSRNNKEVYAYKELWTDSIPVTVEHVGDKTILHFSYTIPKEQRPSDQAFRSLNNFRWEIKLAFVELMESIERIWKITVAR